MLQTIAPTSTKFSVLAQGKAILLCVLMLIASTPILHAGQPQAAAPLETNCQVNWNGCVGPCSYTVTVEDSTPGALIHYTVYCNGSYWAAGEVYSGHQFTVWACLIMNGNGSGYGNQYYPGYLTGNMYATASGYSQSQEGYLGF